MSNLEFYTQLNCQSSTKRVKKFFQGHGTWVFLEAVPGRIAKGQHSKSKKGNTQDPRNRGPNLELSHQEMSNGVIAGAKDTVSPN